jgi:hypothetical protein
MDENQLELIPTQKSEKPKPKAPHLTLAKVESSNIRSMGYCLETQILGVKFNDGSVYLYAGVAGPIWERLQDSESKGSFLNREIKGHYACTKIVDET